MKKQTTIMVNKANHEWLNELKHKLNCNSFNELFYILKNRTENIVEKEDKSSR